MIKIMKLLLILSCAYALAMDNQKNIELKQVAYFFKRYTTHKRRPGIIFYNKDREPIGVSLGSIPNILGTLKEHAGNNIFLADTIEENNDLPGIFTTYNPK